MSSKVVAEFESVEAFVDFLLQEERQEFTFEEAETLAEGLGQTTAFYVIRQLKAYGLSMKLRLIAKAIRGFSSPNHDRFYGKGSCASHGGSGWEQITGFSGREG